MTTGVYIARDAEGVVLYVGSSGDVEKRLGQHRNGPSPWWADHATISVLPTGTRFTALTLEREKIRELRPTHNQMSRDGAKTISRNIVGPVITPRPEALANLIESHGSVAKLAKAVGIDHMTMSNIWRGVTLPSSKVVARLIVVAASSFDELFAVEIVGDADSEWLAKRERKSS